MKEGKKATFKFTKFQIPEFWFKDNDAQANANVSIRFDPSGTYNEKTGIFKLNVIFSAVKEDEKEFIHTSFIAYFEFDEPSSLDELPPFFYRNSLAIVFPYVRSFISTLTLQANTNLLILPVLNLSELERPLKSNTTIEV